MNTRLLTRFALLAAAALVPALAQAQTTDEINAAIEFDFSTPGARSLAMGGAFVGLADDATAAFTNPAGLTILSKPEVSAEYRHPRHTNTFTSGGHAFGPASGQGVDTVDGLVEGESEKSVDSLAFASVVYPGEKWAVSVYRQELANLEAEIRSEGAFVASSRIFPVISDLDLEIDNYGFSGAVELDGGLSIGIGLSYYDFRLRSTTRRYDLDSFFGPATYEDVVNSQVQDGDDDDWAFNIGFLWQATSKLAIGGVYREGPRFDFDALAFAGDVEDGLLGSAQEAVFHVPDVYGLGIAWKPTDQLTVVADYDRVVYGKLTDEVVDIFGEDPEIVADRLDAEDADEVHLGAEYIFSQMRWPLAVRGGFWYDPAHRTRFTPELQEDDPLFDARVADAALFRESDDDYHFSGGAGLVLGERLQIDGAFSLSDRVDVLSISSVFRF